MDQHSNKSGGNYVLKVGMIGAGTMGRIHSASISASGMAKVEKIYALDDGAAQLAAIHDAAVARTAAEIINDPAIDVVVIASPTDTHAGYLSLCHAAEKHVFCEKPVVRTENEADIIEKLFAGYDRHVTVGHVVRFMGEYQQMREKVQSEALGSIGTARFGRCGSFPVGWNNWFGDFERSGGVILDLSIHDLDTLAWTFGPVDRVYAMCTGGKEPGHEYALIIARLKSGVIAHIEGSWAESKGLFYTYYEIAGSHGLVEFDDRTEPALMLYRKTANEGANADRVMTPSNPAIVDPYAVEMRSYLAAVKNNKQPEVTLADGLYAARLALAAMKSAKEDRPVLLS